MDGTTEPIIAVLGHPIAGNPSQLAIERAFEAMKLDWRVMSFDVTPENLPVALHGLEVLGVRGILLGKNLVREAAQWAAGHLPDQPSPAVLDCFYRDPIARSGLQGTVSESSGLLGFDAEGQWISAQIHAHFSAKPDDSAAAAYVIGEMDRDLDSLFPEPFREALKQSLVDSDASSIPAADVILVGGIDADAVALEIEDLSTMPSSSLVIDLSNSDVVADALEDLDTTIINIDQRRVGMICQCIEKWVGKIAPEEIVIDAIEEYMAV
ncbi:hypothetical protein RMSM_02202 [Rhodopirellula maiorica SM1]|uniref:Shikimate 5-dehydrogenase n=1 Tax=Rhodopirellula maiorica SM1 TaxID=1265738 RepID=M5RNV4_9BACT|nr:hypothetical protein [Rhodopirellula maiorica]EMI20871.1 hypothetical protein RMSM_02202 [Rhodopirellula maiorica SM1]